MHYEESDLRLQSSLTEEELQRVFTKYASLPDAESNGAGFNVPGSPARNPLELAIQSAAITAALNLPAIQESPAERTQDAAQAKPGSSRLAVPSCAGSDTATAPTERPAVTHDKGVWTCKAFTSFLLSPENSAFREEKMDMTRPLAEYFVSSSHNTYLVGHQLVGESTIEGYARALLHGCRSVEGECAVFFGSEEIADHAFPSGRLRRRD